LRFSPKSDKFPLTFLLRPTRAKLSISFRDCDLKPKKSRTKLVAAFLFVFTFEHFLIIQ